LSPVGSKNVARDRLKAVLVQDRAEANRGFLEKIKDDIIGVVARYADVDAARAEVRLSREDTQAALVARIPICNLRRVT